MTASDADAIINRYMHEYNDGKCRIGLLAEYSKDLNLLIPVWEKLKVLRTQLIHELHPSYSRDEPRMVIISPIGRGKIGSCGSNIQTAAAIATAKTIQQLNK